MDKENVRPGRKVKIIGGEWEGQTAKVMGSPAEWAGNKWMVSVRLNKPGLGVWETIVSVDIELLEFD